MSNLQNKNFNLIFISKVLFSTGIGIYTIFLLLHIWNYYNSALAISLFYMIVFLIPTITSPIVGITIDKHSKKNIGGLSLLLSLFITLLIFLYPNTYLLVIVFIAILIFETYFNTNYVVAVRLIVKDENLIYANNMRTISIGFTNFIGYIIGAYFYSTVNFRLLLLIILVLFAISLVIWIFAHIPEQNRKKERKNIKYREIFSYIHKNMYVFYLILIYDVVVLLTIAMVIPAYIPYCFNYLNMSAIVYGAYAGLSSLLLVLVPILLHRYINTKKVKEYATHSLFYEGFITIIIGAIPILISLHFFKILIFILLTSLITIPSTLEITSFSTIFQKIVPINMLGRFSSLRSIFRGIINSIGLIIAGFAIDVLGPIPIIIISGIILLVIVPPLKTFLNSIY